LDQTRYTTKTKDHEFVDSKVAILPTTRVETIVAPITNFVKGGVLIGSSKNLGHGSGRVSTGRNLNRSLELPTRTIRVIGTP
jgi:hypothetical protein